ncbi:MAG: alpha/beta hydrolase, partial [Rhodocyclaceae bacterium]|nr:alpha/beta hydrolase [Rhodocyclaceae bacterium]
SAWQEDQKYLDRPGSEARHMMMFKDYQTNVALYGQWQNYFRTRQPKTLVVWGKNDPFFGPAGAEAFKRDLPDAQVHLLDTGHFALEEDAPVIAELIKKFF